MKRLIKKIIATIISAAMMFMSVPVSAEGEILVDGFETLQYTHLYCDYGTAPENISFPLTLGAYQYGEKLGGDIYLGANGWECWECDAGFDPNTPGDYIFTPIIPALYEVVDGTALPTLTVTIRPQEITLMSITSPESDTFNYETGELGSSLDLVLPTGYAGVTSEGVSVAFDTGLEWTRDPSFSAGIAGTYVFTPDFPDNVTIDPSVTVPVITIVITDPIHTPGTPDTRWYPIQTAAGKGTAIDSYFISTADELAGLAVIVNTGLAGFNEDQPINFSGKYVSMNAATIDLSAYTNWTPIGASQATPFRGFFDGSGCVISGLTINRPGVENVGLFGFKTEAPITDLGLTNVSVTGGNKTGGLAGYVGGLGDRPITNCFVTGTVNGADNVGGIVGQAGDFINNSYANVIVTGTGNNVGGIAGYSTKKIEYCYATGTVSGVNNVGGIVGNTTVLLNLLCVALNESVTASGENAGKIAGNSPTNNALNYSWGSMTLTQGSETGTPYSGTSASYRDITVYNSNMWSTFLRDSSGFYISSGNLPLLSSFGSDTQSTAIPSYIPDNTTSDYYSGEGTSASPFLITNYYDLAILADLVNDGDYTDEYYYQLTNDITLYDTWTPIGTTSNPFVGTFDGNNKIISGLSITGTGNYMGLFGQTGKDSATTATITDLAVTGASVAGGERVGIIAGYAYYTTIERCYVSGNVSGTSHVGGVAGIASLGTIQNCRSDSTVSASGSYVGGIAGDIVSNNIGYSITSGSVSSSSQSNPAVGGIVGDASGTNPLIAYCVVIAEVTQKGTNSNRIVGYSTSASLSNNHAWAIMDGDWTNIAATGNSGADVSSAVLATQGFWSAIYASSAWSFGANSIMPVLTGFTTGTMSDQLPDSVSGDFSGSGTESDPYIIRTEADLRLLAAKVNESDSSKRETYSGKYFALANDITLTEDWIPIGTGTTAGYCFQGVFMGNGKVIRNLTIASGYSSFAGLFYALSGDVCDLGLENVDITTTGNGSGGIAGYVINSGEIWNCYVTGSINGSCNVGGIAGMIAHSASVYNCYSSATITSTDTTGTFGAGGIVGCANGNGPSQYCNIYECYFTGTVSSSGACTGGILGYGINNYCNVEYCVVLSNSISGGTSGRIVGYTKSGTLTSNYAWADLTGTSETTGHDGTDITSEEVVIETFWVDTDGSGIFTAEKWFVYDYALPILSCFPTGVQNNTYPSYITTQTPNTDVLGGEIEIDNESPRYGDELSVDITDLTGAVGTVSYQWYRSGTALPIGSSATYTVVEADIDETITVIVRAASSSGSVTSAATAAVAKAIPTAPTASVNTVTSSRITLAPVTNAQYYISGANVTAGWDDDNDFTGLTSGTSYTLKVRLIETSTHESVESAAVTVSTLALIRELNLTVTISGTPAVGETLTAGITGLPATIEATDISYAWYVYNPPQQNAVISGYIGNTFSNITADYVGSMIIVEISIDGYEETEASIPTAAIAESGNTGGDTGNTGGDTGNTGGDTGNTGGDTGNTGGDTGNTGGDTGNTGGDTGNTGGDTGNTGGGNSNVTPPSNTPNNNTNNSNSGYTNIAPPMNTPPVPNNSNNNGNNSNNNNSNNSNSNNSNNSNNTSNRGNNSASNETNPYILPSMDVTETDEGTVFTTASGITSTVFVTADDGVKVEAGVNESGSINSQATAAAVREAAGIARENGETSVTVQIPEGATGLSKSTVEKLIEAADGLAITLELTAVVDGEVVGGVTIPLTSEDGQPLPSRQILTGLHFDTKRTEKIERYVAYTWDTEVLGSFETAQKGGWGGDETSRVTATLRVGLDKLGITADDGTKFYALIYDTKAKQWYQAEAEVIDGEIVIKTKRTGIVTIVTDSVN